jgi:hypothetical protein
MKAQLYLQESVRNQMKKPIELFAETYTKKITSLFAEIEQESKAIADERYNELGKNFHPDFHDAADLSEAALDTGLEHYEGLALMQYNTKLMWISTLYQFWEQQVRKFIFEEVNRTQKFTDKKGNKIAFKDFCTRGIQDIKETFKLFDQDLEKFSSWDKLNELRLLANVIKHADGPAATQLKLIRPDIFKDKSISTDLLDLYKTTLNEIVLNIGETEFQDYCEAIIHFWDELPERMYAR